METTSNEQAAPASAWEMARELARPLLLGRLGWAAVAPLDEQDRRRWVYLRRQDGAELGVELDTSTRPGRWAIRGGFPHGLHGHYYAPYVHGTGTYERHAIGCALNKTPMRVARDIEARLLPEYLPAYEKAAASKAADEAAQAEAVRTVRGLGKVLGVEPRASGGGKLEESHEFKLYAGPIEVRLSSYGSVRFEVSVPDRALALDVARVLVELLPREDPDE